MIHKIKDSRGRGFTLVELLAVIVILAIILVIAVPKVMSVIEDAKKATLESTAKMIASQAEKQKVQNTVLGSDKNITCKDITNINDVDYEDCDIVFDNNTAKVTIEGSGKFEGLFVCNGTKTESTATEESCSPVVNAVSFSTDSWETIVAAVKQAETNGTEYPYNVGNEKTVDMGSLGVHTIRVANTTKCSEVTVESKTACGFVLEFADIITTHEMNGEPVGNTGDTNYGGWPASEMRTYLNDLDANDTNDGIIYNALPDALRNGIIDTYVVSSYGYDKTTGVVENENAGVLESELYWSNDKLYLLSTTEIHAQESSETITRCLDYYVLNRNNYYGGRRKSSGKIWWLRTAWSSTYDCFYCVDDYGDPRGYGSSSAAGVSPAFRLAN